MIDIAECVVVLYVATEERTRVPFQKQPKGLTPKTVRNINQMISSAFELAKSQKLALAIQNGVDLKTVSGMLGHFSAGFTLDTYAHVTTPALKEAANTMGNVLSKAV